MSVIFEHGSRDVRDSRRGGFAKNVVCFARRSSEEEEDEEEEQEPNEVFSRSLLFGSMPRRNGKSNRNASYKLNYGDSPGSFVLVRRRRFITKNDWYFLRMPRIIPLDLLYLLTMSFPTLRTV